jgi:hypothetical protein
VAHSTTPCRGRPAAHRRTLLELRTSVVFHSTALSRAAVVSQHADWSRACTCLAIGQVRHAPRHRRMGQASEISRVLWTLPGETCYAQRRVLPLGPLSPAWCRAAGPADLSHGSFVRCPSHWPSPSVYLGYCTEAGSPCRPRRAKT